ncbi:MAG: flavin reductase family protein [Saprospirales bacterium]|nr:MAG: flavin reductase family protein [Saprospirales bacterium]
MITINPEETKTKDLHQFLLGIVAPRPIAFVSTVDENGVPNLAPYSFFNAFSSNPPIVVFSSNRRVLDNTTKDTLHNIEKTGEAVINAVSHSIVRQMAVSSIQFPRGVNEFEKSGLTPVPSDLVAPPRVKESPAHLECRMEEIKTLGKHGGAGHLIICRVLRVHLDENVVDDNRINPHKIDLMGRMGRAYYTRASGDAIHTIVQPVTRLSIGFDQLPDHVKHSPNLTGNELGLLAGLEKWPDKAEAREKISGELLKRIDAAEGPYRIQSIHLLAKRSLAGGNPEEAARILANF